MLTPVVKGVAEESLPKIGIRPVIDGRRNGVRESLEEPIMSMARSVERLISTELRHSSGEPVECVIPDHTIGGAAEAARCAELFRRKGVGAVIDVTRCWCYAAEILQLDPSIPYAVWGFIRRTGNTPGYEISQRNFSSDGRQNHEPPNPADRPPGAGRLGTGTGLA